MRISILLLIAFLSCAAIPGQAQWAQTSGPGVVGIQSLLVGNGSLYAGTAGQGVYRSVNEGSSWSASNTGLESATVYAIAANSTDLYAGLEFNDASPGGVRRSTNEGQDWTDAGLHGQLVVSVYAEDAFTLAGTVGAGLFKSTNAGGSWSPPNPDIGMQSVRAIVRSGANLYLAGDNNLYVSADNGDHWVFTNGGQFFPIFCLRVDGSFIYAGGFTGLIRSTNGGASWSGPIWIDFLPDGSRITSFTVAGPILYASVSGAPGAGVIQSADNGQHWTPANAGIESVSVAAVEATGGVLIAGTLPKGALRSVDGGAHWTGSNAGLPPGGNLRSLLVDGTALLAGTGGDGVYRTADAGDHWTQISADPSGALDDEFVESLFPRPGALLAATFIHGVFRSTDDGASWVPSNTGLPLGPVFNVFDIDSAGAAVLAGTSQGIFRSTDGGQSWLPTSITDGIVFSLTSEPGFAYAIVNTGIGTTTGVYRSTNDGQTWALVLLAGFANPIVLAADDGFVYLGDLLSGIRRSSNHGIDWSGSSLPDGGVFAILPQGSTVYAGTQASIGGIYLSTDHGGSWNPMNAGLPSTIAIEALASDGTFVYGGTDREAVWRFPLQADGLSDLAAAPSPRLELRAVGPNPFRTMTGFDLALPASVEVRLWIYDASGRVVGGPFARTLPAGSQRWDYDGAQLGPGVFTYRLAAGGEVATGKLVHLVP